MTYTNTLTRFSSIAIAVVVLFAALFLGASSIYAEQDGSTFYSNKYSYADYKNAESKTKEMVRKDMMQAREEITMLRKKHQASRMDFIKTARDYEQGNATAAEFDAAVASYKNAVMGVRDEYVAVRDDWKLHKEAARKASAEKRVEAREKWMVAKEEFKKTRMERFQKRCALRDNRHSAVEGFGVPYNVNKASRSLLMDVACDTDTPDFTLEVGEGDTTDYIYKYGYVYDNDAKKWVKFDFESINGEEVGDWIVGDAFVDIEEKLNMTEMETHVVAFVCSWNGSSWKCGCSDSQCRAPKWMLQSVPAFNDQETPSYDENEAASGEEETSTVNEEEEEKDEEEEEEEFGTEQEFTISASNFEFDVNDITVKKGDTVTITLDVEEGTHDWRLDEFGAKTDALNGGERGSVTFVADEVGEFEFYCSIGNHRDLGMVGTLTVK